MTLATAKDFEVHGRATRKAEFLARMEALVPWAQFCAVIEPHYPKAGNGRPPVGLERMLRMYLVANWFNLGDEACEDALYDIPAFRDFCRIDLGRERVPDATTLLNFRHLLEKHQIGAALFADISGFTPLTAALPSARAPCRAGAAGVRASTPRGRRRRRAERGRAARGAIASAESRS